MRGQKRYVTLTETELLEVTNLFKNSKSTTVRERAHYLILSNQGKSAKEISDIYDIQKSTVFRWFDRYQQDGIVGLQTAKGRGRPPILRIDNEAEVKKIEELIEANPQSLKAVIAGIQKDLGKDPSEHTLRRFLKKKIFVGNDLEKECQKTQIPKSMIKK